MALSDDRYLQGREIPRNCGHGHRQTLATFFHFSRHFSSTRARDHGEGDYSFTPDWKSSGSWMDHRQYRNVSVTRGGSRNWIALFQSQPISIRSLATEPPHPRQCHFFIVFNLPHVFTTYPSSRCLSIRNLQRHIRPFRVRRTGPRFNRSRHGTKPLVRLETTDGEIYPNLQRWPTVYRLHHFLRRPARSSPWSLNIVTSQIQGIMCNK